MFEFTREAVAEHARFLPLGDHLVAYIFDHAPVGDFLAGILSNDLKRAVYHADGTNGSLIHGYVKFLYNYAPADCWGSVEKFKGWMNDE